MSTNENLNTEYRDLLIRKDSLIKESEHVWVRYVQIFGDLLESLLNAKIQCIALKKKISYCQKKRNFNEPINACELESYIESELLDYKDDLNYIIQLKNSPKTEVSHHDVLLIKKIYRKLAYMIHPDVHPEYFCNEEIKELWTRAKNAYISNDLAALKETEFLITEAISRFSNSTLPLEIDDIEERINATEKEIMEIVNTNPYQYKRILEDESLIEEEKGNLNDQISFYSDYESELQETFSNFNVTEILC